MAWVRGVPAEAATDRLQEVYEGDVDDWGFVLGGTQALSSQPDLAGAYQAFKRTLFALRGLSQREKRLIHLLIADRLGSTGCVYAYAAALERDLGGLQGILAVLEDHRQAGLSEREVAILDYALTLALGRPIEEDVTRLRRLGFDDGEIVAIAAHAALRTFGSRLYNGLGVEPDAFLLEQADLVETIGPRLAAARA